MLFLAGLPTAFPGTQVCRRNGVPALHQFSEHWLNIFLVSKCFPRSPCPNNQGQLRAMLLNICSFNRMLGWEKSPKSGRYLEILINLHQHQCNKKQPKSYTCGSQLSCTVVKPDSHLIQIFCQKMFCTIYIL